MLARLLKYAILAPSPHNSQPWKFRAEGDHLDLFGDRERSLPTSDPRDRQLHIGCGAALLNLRVAVRRFGNADHVELLPEAMDPSHLARIRLGDTVIPSPRDRWLFDAIPRRRTNRRAFELRPVGHRIFRELAEAARLEGAWLARLHPEDKPLAASLIARADRERSLDRAHGGALAAQHRDLVLAAPVLAVLGTPGDDARDWLCAGQALQRVLLAARVHGLSASFLNQPVEVEHLRPALAALAGHAGAPQLLLRMGYGPRLPAVPRRPVSEVLVASCARRARDRIVPRRLGTRPRPAAPAAGYRRAS